MAKPRSPKSERVKVVRKLDLKNLLKSLKLNESTVSMILGILVVATAAILVFNYFRNQKKGEITPEGGSGQNENFPQTSNHKVVKGESLWSISEKYYQTGFKWTEIAKANNLDKPYLIEVDQELKIPELKESAKNPEPITGATYTVVKGDSLWNISVRAYGDGYKWVEISRENKLVNPSLIHSGNTLVLPR